MKRLTKWDWMVIAVMLVGAGFRLYHLCIFPFDEPFRLGGLFYEFSRQIMIHNFAFPETIPYYSAGGIPFAYPPLGFYAQATIIQLFHPPLFVTVNLLPPLITLLSLPAFYWMIQQHTDDIRVALAGLFAFALIPTTFMNQIEAAGLAESFGIVILIFYLGFLLRWKKHPNWKDTILAGFSLGFCILSSPGSAYASTLLSVLFFIWVFIQGLKKRSLKPAGMLMILGIIGILVSAPYWLSVMHNHGTNFFIKPFLGQHQADTSPQQIDQIISFQPAGESLSFIWNWLVLAGLFWTILKRHFLTAMIFTVFWLIPREGIWLVSIPAAILAGSGLVNILFPLFRKAFQSANSSRPPLAPGILGVLMLILVFANTFIKITVLISEPEWYISREQINALVEFQDEIPKNGKVIVIGNTALTEWAPAILQREVLNIEFGLEWQPDELEKVQSINAALEQNDFAGMLSALNAYTNDRQVYLVSSSIDLNALQNTILQNTNLLQLASTPALNLHIIDIK